MVSSLLSAALLSSFGAAPNIRAYVGGTVRPRSFVSTRTLFFSRPTSITCIFISTQDLIHTLVIGEYWLQWLSKLKSDSERAISLKMTSLHEKVKAVL